MSGETTDFLYPFIEGGEQGAGELLADLARSAAAKAATSAELRRSTIAGADLDAVAGAMAARLGAGGRLLAFGNGGSSTDAAGIAALFRDPPRGRPLDARCLAADRAVMTALANDIGFEVVFSRQILAFGTAGDVALGVSTSGNSVNLLAAFAAARRLGMLTVGLAGYDGGQMAASADVDHCVVVRSDSVHRIQETQDAVAFELWQRVQSCLPGTVW
jgi:D-sedoheptulose 7-phosphate isomerase